MGKLLSLRIALSGYSFGVALCPGRFIIGVKGLIFDIWEGMMQLLVIDDSSIWDDFADRSPYGSLFHKWGFLKTIEKHTGYTLLPYGMYSDYKLICIFPAFLKANYGLNVVLSPPRAQGYPTWALH